ncbi:MAG: hypothetical protein RI947_1270 [Candidatus Parcubacteria bacterium]|jgi:hypothetical protein
MNLREKRIKMEAFAAAVVIIMLLFVAEAMRVPPRFAAFFVVAIMADALIMVLRLYYFTPKEIVEVLPALPPLGRVYVTMADTRWRGPYDGIVAYVQPILLDIIEQLGKDNAITPLMVTENEVNELQELLGNFTQIGFHSVGLTDLQPGDRVIVVHGDLTSYLLMTSGPMHRPEEVPDIWYEVYVIL